MKKFFLMISLIFSMISFAHSSEIKKNHLAAPISSLRLGDGYVTYDHMGIGESALRLEDTQISYTNMQNSINLSQTIDRYDLAKNLNMDFSVSGGWGPFSASASANFLKHTENTQFSENFSYAERYYVNALLDISHLPADSSAFTSGAENLYKKYGIAAFNLRYGDTFIKELPLGAFLVANLRLTFATTHDKEKFDGSLSGGISSIFEASADIQRAVTTSRAKGTIEVAAYQLGGDPSELPKIFSKKTTDGYYITTCSLENLRDCQGVIDGIISYALNNFNKQIKPTSLNGKPEGNLVVVGEPVLDSYTLKFMLEPAEPLDPKVVMDRLELATMYNSLKAQKTFFDHYVNSPAAGFFTPEGDQLIRNTQQSLDWNASLFDQFGAISCYLPGKENQCHKVIENLKQYNKPVDQKIVDYYMNTGYYETNANCMFVPVGIPNQDTPIFAGMCDNQWINGIYTFKLAADKSKLESTGDYFVSGSHIQSQATSTPYGSYFNYSGMAYFHNLTTNQSEKHPVSIRVTQNKT